MAFRSKDIRVTPDISRSRAIPSGFDWEWYLKLNPDLVSAGMSNEGDAITHWMRWGYAENRPYKKPEDPTIFENSERDNSLIEIFDSNPIDYAYRIFDQRNKRALINFIIPIRGRSTFLKKTIETVKEAAEKFKKGPGLFSSDFDFGDVNITVCEHSSDPEHRQTSEEMGVDYIWIESGDRFNKCLAMNTAAFFAPRTKWLVFHDVDCLVQSDFFINVFKNINKKKCKAIQTFSDRRVLYLDYFKTMQVRTGAIKVDQLTIGPGVSPPMRPDGSIAYGAPGGSICVDRSLFFKVGGYDPYYFVSYAPEDIFFWIKVEVYEVFETCTSPRNEIYHMEHPRVEIDATELASMEMLKIKFDKLPIEAKIDLLKKMNDKIVCYE